MSVGCRRRRFACAPSLLHCTQRPPWQKVICPSKAVPDQPAGLACQMVRRTSAPSTKLKRWWPAASGSPRAGAARADAAPSSQPERVGGLSGRNNSRCSSRRQAAPRRGCNSAISFLCMMHVFVFEGLVVQILQNCNQENLPVLQLCSCVMLLRRRERHETRRDNKAPPPHLFALCRAARGFAAGAGWLKEGCYALLAACLGAGI